MKEINEYQQDLASIRAIMERSVKFVSLSGLSGVLAGMYAIAGAVAAYFVIYYPNSPFGFRFYYINETATLIQLFSIAVVVLAASLLTGYWMSARKAKKLGIPVWDNTSRQLLMDLLIPLATGGIFIIILALRGYFVIIASACLLFYGLALINASGRTFKEIKYLGLLEIVLGLTSSLYPGYGLIFWAIGFGVLHIIYGILMHYRYDK
jgi:predicted lysophospholipase L1 biosynthesis ABC-type transport system permease subunit